MSILIKVNVGLIFISILINVNVGVRLNCGVYVGLLIFNFIVGGLTNWINLEYWIISLLV